LTIFLEKTNSLTILNTILKFSSNFDEIIDIGKKVRKMSERLNFYTIQKRLKSIVELKNKMNGNAEFVSDKAYKNFELKFDNFDWDKYADAINQARSNSGEDSVSKNTSIFSVLDNSSMSDDEKSFAQLLDVLTANESVFKELDADLDSILTGEEMKAYFDGINALDRDEDNLSLKDVAKFMADKGVSFEEDETKVQEAYTTYQNEQLAAQQSASMGGGGGGGGYVSSGSSAAAGSQKKEEPYKDKIDTTSLTGAQKQLYAELSAENVASIANFSSADLSKPLADGSNGMASMINMSKEDREKLQQAAANKETAFKNVETSKEAVKNSESEVVSATETYETAVQTQAAAQEALLGTQALIETYSAQSENLGVSIITIGESIDALKGQIQNVPSLSAEATDAEKSNRAQIIAANNAIKAQIAALQEDKTKQEKQKEEVDTQLEEAKTLEKEQQTELDNANEALETARNKIDEIKNTEMSEAEKAYMDSVSAYDAACSEYNSVKAEVMANVNKEIKEEGAKAVEQRKTEDINVQAPVVNEATMFIADTFDEMHKLENGEMKPEEASEQNRALWEKYSKFTDEQKEQIAKMYGSEDDFFIFISTLNVASITDAEGNPITYAEIMLNPEYFESSLNALEQYKTGSGDDAEYDAEKIAAEMEAMQTTTPEEFNKYFTYYVAATGEETIEQIVPFITGSSNFDKTLLDTRYTYLDADEIIEKATQDATKAFEESQAAIQKAQEEQVEQETEEAESKLDSFVDVAMDEESEAFKTWNGKPDTCVSYLKDCMIQAGYYIPDEVYEKYSAELKQYFIDNGAVVIDANSSVEEKEALMSSIKPGYVFARGTEGHMGIVIKVNDDGSFVTQDGGGTITTHTRDANSKNGDYYIFDPDKLPKEQA